MYCSILYVCMNFALLFQKTLEELAAPSRLTLLVQSLRKQDASTEVSPFMTDLPTSLSGSNIYLTRKTGSRLVFWELIEMQPQNE